MTDRTAYGGQAVIEGVMIRGKEHVATAVRLNDGSIIVRHDMVDGWSTGKSWLRLAFVRGLPALVDSLRLGYRTLMWSADQVMEAEEQQKITPITYVLTILGAFVFAIGLFVLFPAWIFNFLFPIHQPHLLLHKAAHGGAAHFFAQFIPTLPTFLRCLGEGLLRVIMLVVYILVIGRHQEIRRVFSYHGAEHKVVNAYEAGAELNVDACRPSSCIHPRCGTSFLFLVFVVGILVHALIGWPRGWVLLVSRLVLLPLVVGVSYELIRLSGRYRHSRLLRALVWPGLLLQRLTTAEPSDDQIEVAIASLSAVLTDEGVLEPESTGIADISAGGRRLVQSGHARAL